MSGQFTFTCPSGGATFPAPPEAWIWAIGPVTALPPEQVATIVAPAVEISEEKRQQNIAFFRQLRDQIIGSMQKK